MCAATSPDALARTEPAVLESEANAIASIEDRQRTPIWSITSAGRLLLGGLPLIKLESDAHHQATSHELGYREWSKDQPWLDPCRG